MQRANNQHSSFIEITQAELKAGEEGWFTPAQIPNIQLLETAQLMSDTLQLVVDQP
ncbi:MAG TPA: hypothetical protein VL866_20160 [Pyrinomonadaceae bacterium]|nr:hypothetical protein [Pyrinomonadaceae bacterium]